MGYDTDFSGGFEIVPALSSDQVDYIKKFCETRRMKRDVSKLGPDPVRDKVNLPCGKDGEFFVGGTGDFGQYRDDSVIDDNKPPSTQPGLWCQWIASDDGTGLYWDGNEKFYDYKDWLQYMIENFFVPWGRTISGSVYWHGEDTDDFGEIKVVNNKMLIGLPDIKMQYKEFMS